MSIIGEFSIRSETFPLRHALEAVPETRVRADQTVPHGSDSPLPYLSVSDGDLEAFEQAMEDDPSVASVQLLDDFDAERLYRVTLDCEFIRCMEQFVDESVAILDAVGTASGWTFVIRFPDHRSFLAFQRQCSTADLSVDLHRLYPARLDNERLNGLTEPQRETLLIAQEVGYFDVPRNATLADVAARLGISDQATSERLRRGMANLIVGALIGTL